MGLGWEQLYNFSIDKKVLLGLFLGSSFAAVSLFYDAILDVQASSGNYVVSSFFIVKRNYSDLA